jgi:hypothetical protein
MSSSALFYKIPWEIYLQILSLIFPRPHVWPCFPVHKLSHKEGVQLAMATQKTRALGVGFLSQWWFRFLRTAVSPTGESQIQWVQELLSGLELALKMKKVICLFTKIKTHCGTSSIIYLKSKFKTWKCSPYNQGPLIFELWGKFDEKEFRIWRGQYKFLQFCAVSSKLSSLSLKDLSGVFTVLPPQTVSDMMARQAFIQNHITNVNSNIKCCWGKYSTS